MNAGTCRYLLLLVLVVVQFDNYECYRSRPSPSRPRPSPSYRPSPTYRPFPRPSPTYRPFPRPSPTFRPFPRPSPTFRPFPQPSPTHKPFPTYSPTRAPTYRPATTYKPFPSHTTYKPFPSHTTYRPFPAQPTHRPFPNYPTARPNYGNTRYPTRYPTQPTRYPTQSNRYPIGPRPTYPGYQDGGIFSPGRRYQPTYSVPVRVPSPGGSRVKVYNINNYHSPGYWAPPSYPVYSYTYRDTGSSALGFYLGYSLGRITHPTYYHHSHSFYDGYSPRYDHYTVHHYYHNNQNIPKEQTITTKVIVQCGDGSQICPANTTSLCTANGQIMCVVISSNTVPCKDNPNLQCVRSTVPCENNDAPECKGIAKGQSAAINIPCISSTTIEGNVTTVNNSLVSTDPVANKTVQSAVLSSSTQQLKTLLPNTNASSTPTQAPVNISSTTPQSTVAMTTLPTIETTLSNVTFPSLGSRKKRAAPPQYCVTILAQPSIRAPTEGEQVYGQITNVFEQFFSKAFGMNKPSK
ncbi:hypothetical protein WA026_009719 [Henosepilachna vigintioctopunctata]|uniref:Uncharacterized protein n=1 Tax=Henosepilachna vigintioctopunctata TaxID=420089 RepID=A0AAW1TL66_9CUCU